MEANKRQQLIERANNRKLSKLETTRPTKGKSRCYRCSRSALTGNGALCSVCLEGDGITLED